MSRALWMFALAVWLCALCALADPPEVCQVDALINCSDDDECFFGGACNTATLVCDEKTPCNLELLAADATYDARRLKVDSTWFDDDFDYPTTEYYNLFYDLEYNEDVEDGCRDLTTPFPIPFYGTNYTEITICVEGFIQLGSNTLYETNMTDSTPDCPITDVAPRILVGHGDWALYYYYFDRDVHETESTEGHEDGLQYWFMPRCQELPEYGACIKVKWNDLQPQDDVGGRFDWSFYAWIWENGVIATVIEEADDDGDNELPANGKMSVGLTSGDGDVLEVFCDTGFYDVIGNFYGNVTANGGQGFGIMYYPTASFTPIPEDEATCLSPANLDATLYCPGGNADLCLFGGACIEHGVANKFDICEARTTASLNAVADSEHYVARELPHDTGAFLSFDYNAGEASVTEEIYDCGNVTLSFEFPFFDTLYTTMTVCTSGYLQFGGHSGSTDTTPTCPLVDEGARILVGHSTWGAYSSNSFDGAGVLVSTYSECPELPEYGKCVTVNVNALQEVRGNGDLAFSFVTLYENGAIMYHLEFPGQEYVQPEDLSIGLTSGDGEVLDVLCTDSGDATDSPLVQRNRTLSLLYEPLWYNEYDVTTSEASPTEKTTNLHFTVTLTTCGTYLSESLLDLTNANLVSVSETSSGVFDVVVNAVDSGVVTVGVRDTIHSASITVSGGGGGGGVDATIVVENAQDEFGNSSSFFGFTLNSPIIFHITFESPVDLTKVDLSASNGTITGIVEGNTTSKKKRNVNAPSLEWTVFVHPTCDGVVTLTYVPSGASASANYVSCLRSLLTN